MYLIDHSPWLAFLLDYSFLKEQLVRESHLNLKSLANYYSRKWRPSFPARKIWSQIESVIRDDVRWKRQRNRRWWWVKNYIYFTCIILWTIWGLRIWQIYLDTILFEADGKETYINVKTLAVTCEADEQLEEAIRESVHRLNTAVMPIPTQNLQWKYICRPIIVLTVNFSTALQKNKYFLKNRFKNILKINEICRKEFLIRTITKEIFFNSWTFGTQ